MKPVVIGTRGSELAMRQACCVRDALRAAHERLEIELRVIRTRGDKVLDSAPGRLDKGLFTREIQTALREGAVDLAVHSLKDLPTDPVEGLALGAVTVREDAADALIAKTAPTLAALPARAKVLTGSPRRKAQLLHFRADLQVLPVRGNVGTRLRKLDESDAEAIVLARAGLVRLGLADRISQRLEPTEFVPACAQGALGIEIRRDDVELAELLRPLDNRAARLATAAERMFLRTLGGGCRIPAGAYAAVEGSTLTITGMVAELGGQRLVKKALSGRAEDMESAETLGRRLGQALLADGGQEILDAVQRQLPGEPEEGP